jgi:single-strand DNA-binding protein
MTGETPLTVVGNLTADPELRYTQNGLPVVNFTVASTPRIYDRQSGEYKDGDALFLRCSAWREMAEHIAGSLNKGTRVIVTGRLTQRSYQDREGQNRTALEVDVDEVGPSLRWATAAVTRAAASGAGSRPTSNPPGEPWSTPSRTAEDAWAPGSGYGDDTPF